VALDEAVVVAQLRSEVHGRTFRERGWRSRTTYRPTVNPTWSTHVTTFTGITSSSCRTDEGRLAPEAGSRLRHIIVG